MNTLEELMHAALAAPSARQGAALRVLHGHAVAVEPGSQASVFEPFLTQREAARRLGVSVPTLWRWRIPGQNLGGRRRFKLSEVEAYFKTEAFERRVAALRAERQQATPKHRARAARTASSTANVPPSGR